MSLKSLNSKWYWSDPDQQNTCTPLSLSWLWQSTETSIRVELSITQIQVPQPEPPSSSAVASATSALAEDVMLVARAAPTHSVGGTFQTSIVRSIRANSSSYLYEQIAVPQGWYQILAYSSDGRIEKRTTSFFVWNGTDTSCLANFPSKTTQDDTPASDTTSITSSTNTSTGSGKSESNKAKMIAGAVVGGFAVLIIVLISIFFLRRRRKHRGTRATSQQPALSLPAAPRTHITPFEIPSLSLPKAPTTEGQLAERIRALEFTIENMRHEMGGLRRTDGPPGYQHETAADNAGHVQELEMRTENLRRELDLLRETALPPGYQSISGGWSEGDSVYFLDEKANV